MGGLNLPLEEPLLPLGSSEPEKKGSRKAAFGWAAGVILPRQASSLASHCPLPRGSWESRANHSGSWLEMPARGSLPPSCPQLWQDPLAALSSAFLCLGGWGSICGAWLTCLFLRERPDREICRLLLALLFRASSSLSRPIWGRRRQPRVGSGLQPATSLFLSALGLHSQVSRGGSPGCAEMPSESRLGIGGSGKRQRKHH